MPLQHTHAEAPEPLYAAPFTERAETASAAAVAELEAQTPRYDTTSVQQILLLAQEMQTRHRETLTPDDIRALGQEIGVEPDFVHRALAHMEAQGKVTETVSANAKHEQEGSRRLSVTTRRRQRLTELAPLVLYLLSTPLVVKLIQILAPAPVHDTHHRHTTTTSPFTLASVIYFGFLFVLPAVLAFCAGFRQKSKRRGAGAGAWYGLVSLLAMGVSVLYSAAVEVHEPGWSGMDVSGLAFYVGVVFFLLLGTWLGYGALLGMGGAIVRKKVSSLRRKKWLRAQTKSGDKKQAGEWV